MKTGMAKSELLPSVLLLRLCFAFLFLSCSGATRWQQLELSQEQPPSNDVDGGGVCWGCMYEPAKNESVDYGRLTIPKPPWKVFRTTDPTDIASLLRAVSSSSDRRLYRDATVAPNGMKHSTACQACAGGGGGVGGIILDMRALPRRVVVDRAGGYVDADGGSLWVEVLEESLRHGVSPRSWTDYLYLTVGGTLSVAGVSGQAFRHGPQISNVLEMDVVTGKGEMLTCSPDRYPDLFYGVLGGMGQFGVITRARIPVHDAPEMVRWVTIPYTEFRLFTSDQEILIASPEPDYVEGSVQTTAVAGNDNKWTTTFTVELVFYYTPGRGEDVQQRVNRALSRLSTSRGGEQSKDATYFDFLNRVKAYEDNLRSLGLWDVPHPWLNVFVPSASIVQFMDVLMETFAANPAVNGPFLIYPFLADKWNPNASAVLPPDRGGGAGGGTVYLVGVLRSAPSCSPGSRCVEDLLKLNRKVVDAAVRGMGAKLYLAGWSCGREWGDHFGNKWERIRRLKERYDPAHVLAPGVKMFKRTH